MPSQSWSSGQPLDASGPAPRDPRRKSGARTVAGLPANNPAVAALVTPHDPHALCRAIHRGPRVGTYRPPTPPDTDPKVVEVKTPEPETVVFLPRLNIMKETGKPLSDWGWAFRAAHGFISDTALDALILHGSPDRRPAQKAA